jgi:hypothetical protein
MHPHTLGAKCAHPSHFKGLGSTHDRPLYEHPAVIVGGLLLAAYFFMPR